MKENLDLSIFTINVLNPTKIEKKKKIKKIFINK